MAETGKPLTAQAREAVSQPLGALARTATAARELAASGDEYTAAALLEDIIAMEKILGRLRQAVTRWLEP